MATVERQIDALGGAPSGHSDFMRGWDSGHKAALTAACEIAADADALIEELLETITDILDGRQTLERWTTDARVLVIRATRQEEPVMATIPYTPADSLLASAAILRECGRDFDADFTQQLAADAAVMPGMYRWHAEQQAARAARFAERRA